MSKLFQKVDTVFVSAENMNEMVTWYEYVLEPLMWVADFGLESGMTK